jgi:hypothetical protein
VQEDNKQGVNNRPLLAVLCLRPSGFGAASAKGRAYLAITEKEDVDVFSFKLK